MVKKSKRLLVVLLLALSIISLLALDRRPVWGDPSQRVWYYGALVPFSVLLDNGIVPHCHDGLGPGNLTCYSTNEELSAATGVDLSSAKLFTHPSAKEFTHPRRAGLIDLTLARSPWQVLARDRVSGEGDSFGPPGSGGASG